MITLKKREHRVTLSTNGLNTAKNDIKMRKLNFFY